MFGIRTALKTHNITAGYNLPLHRSAFESDSMGPKEFESAGKDHASRGLEMTGGIGWEAGIRTPITWSRG
jgi:hypothetical protein